MIVIQDMISCIHCVLQTNTHFDSGYLCNLKPIEPITIYGPFYERIDENTCLACNKFKRRNQSLDSRLIQNDFA
jgi:hypothetical protein